MLRPVPSSVDAGRRMAKVRQKGTGAEVALPSLNIFARRTGIIACGQQIDVDRPLDALRADIALLMRQVQRTRHIDRLVSHRASLRNRLVVRENFRSHGRKRARERCYRRSQSSPTLVVLTSQSY